MVDNNNSPNSADGAANKGKIRIPAPTAEDKYVINKHNQESITKYGIPIALATCGGIYLASYKNVIKRSGFKLVPFYMGSFLMSIFTGRLMNRRAMAEELMTLDTPLGHFLRDLKNGMDQQKGSYEQPYRSSSNERSINFSEPVSTNPVDLSSLKMNDPFEKPTSQSQSGKKNKYGDDMVSD